MAYHRILSRVEEEWPGAPVLIASWDFAMHWMPHEVQELLKELDPVRHVILDYTADTSDRENNFETWGFRGNYPWIFGIFHAFEPNSELRGDYPELAKRLAAAMLRNLCGFCAYRKTKHTLHGSKKARHRKKRAQMKNGCRKRKDCIRNIWKSRCGKWRTAAVRAQCRILCAVRS